MPQTWAGCGRSSSAPLALRGTLSRTSATRGRPTCHRVLRIDPTLIEKMMGHAGHTVTSRHYDRPDEEMFAEAVAKAYAAHPFADTWGI